MYSPLSDATTSDNESDVLVESCLKEFEEKGFNISNVSGEKGTMNGLQVSSHNSSHSYNHETSTNSYYTSHNGSSSRYHSSKTQSSYHSNGGLDRPHRPEPEEELYDFGSVKYSQNGSVNRSQNGSLTYTHISSANYSQHGGSDVESSVEGSLKSSRSYRDNKLDQEYMDELFDDMMSQISSISQQSEPVHQYSSTGFSKKASSSSSRSATLPRSNGHAVKRDLKADEMLRHNSNTLPRMREEDERPTSSTPLAEPISEAIVEEERHNPDGTTSLIRRIVTATTTRVFHENQVPQVEVHISPATETIIPSAISDDEGPQLNSSSISQQQHVITTSTYQDEQHIAGYKQTREMQHGVLNRAESDQSYDASGSQLDYSGYEDSDMLHQRLYNGRTTKSSVSNTSYLNDQRGRSRQRQGHHNNSRQTSTSSYNSRDRRIDEEELNATDIGIGLEAVDTSSLRNESFYKSSTGAISSSSNMNMTSKSSSTNVQMSTSSSKQASSSAVASRRQQNGHDFSTLDAKIREKKSQNEIDVSLLDLLMYLKTSDIVLKANTAGYIMHLSYNDDEIKRRIREFDIIPLLVKLLDHEDEDCHRNAAGALRNLSYGKFVNDNKVAIHDGGGIAACVRLLYRTTWIEVRQHVTGILCNLSSYESLKLEILRSAMEAVALLIIIPLSGWEKEAVMKGGRISYIVSWSVLLRNATGILRNVSSAGVEARRTIRSIEGLIDACIWILRAAVASEDNGHVNIKIVENVMCTLRNISYKIDLEVDQNVHLDAVKVANKNTPSTSRDQFSTNEGESTNEDIDRKKKKKDRLIPEDASKTGCLGMKKKPFKKRSNKKGNTPKTNGKPPPEPWAYNSPYATDDNHKPMGVELLWQPETITIYIFLITNSTNPLTLEAAAAAVHNLCGCKWNWAALLRIHVRVKRGLPPLHDLLTVDQEYVVRSVAYALRNLAIDSTNKWSIGWFAPEGLIQVLPSVNSIEADTRPSEYTICAILSVLQAIVYKDATNSKKVKYADGIVKLVALTRETPKETKEEKTLRTYSNKVITEANRVLLYMWDFKECREAIKKSMWSLQRAQEGERIFKQTTLKNPKNQSDTIADVDSNDLDIPLAERDARRFVSFEQKVTSNGETSQQNFEMKDFGYQDVHSDEADESEALIRRSYKQKKNNSNSKTVSNDRYAENEPFLEDEGEMSAV